MQCIDLSQYSGPGGGEHSECLPGGDEPLPAHVQDDLLGPGLAALRLEAGHGETGRGTMGGPLYKCGDLVARKLGGHFLSVGSLSKLCWRVNIDVKCSLSCQLLMTINHGEINGISIPVF